MLAPSNCEGIVSKRQKKQQNQSLLTILVPMSKMFEAAGLEDFLYHCLFIYYQNILLA